MLTNEKDSRVVMVQELDSRKGYITNILSEKFMPKFLSIVFDFLMN